MENVCHFNGLFDHVALSVYYYLITARSTACWTGPNTVRIGDAAEAHGLKKTDVAAMKFIVQHKNGVCSHYGIRI